MMCPPQGGDQGCVSVPQKRWKCCIDGCQRDNDGTAKWRRISRKAAGKRGLEFDVLGDVYADFVVDGDEKGGPRWCHDCRLGRVAPVVLEATDPPMPTAVVLPCGLCGENGTSMPEWLKRPCYLALMPCDDYPAALCLPCHRDLRGRYRGFDGGEKSPNKAVTRAQLMEARPATLLAGGLLL